MGGQKPMTGMDDVERQTIHGDPEILEQKTKGKGDCCTWRVGGIFVVVFSLCVIVPSMLLHQDVHYYVAIDSVSSLDSARGLFFNLTLGVSSWSYGAKACIKPGTYVDVSYSGVKLAASEAETGWLCVGPWKLAEQRVTAIAVPVTGVPVGQVLDRLTTDMKQGAAVFNVTLHLPARSYGMAGSYDGGDCVSDSECGGRRVGTATAWCDAPDQVPYLGPDA